MMTHSLLLLVHNHSVCIEDYYKIKDDQTHLSAFSSQMTKSSSLRVKTLHLTLGAKHPKSQEICANPFLRLDF